MPWGKKAGGRTETERDSRVNVGRPRDRGSEGKGDRARQERREGLGNSGIKHTHAEIAAKHGQIKTFCLLTQQHLSPPTIFLWLSLAFSSLSHLTCRVVSFADGSLTRRPEEPLAFPASWRASWLGSSPSWLASQAESLASMGEIVCCCVGGSFSASCGAKGMPSACCCCCCCICC